MAASVIDDLLESISDGVVHDIRVGAFWTAVIVEVEGHRRCGLASNLRSKEHCHEGKAVVDEAGRLKTWKAKQLCELSRSKSLMEASIGMATINGLLPLQEERYVDLNAEEVIARHGEDKQVALVGNFPFIPRLRERVGSLCVLEQSPKGDQIPADAASDVIPESDVVAITGTALINHTFEGLLSLCRSDAVVLVLGPSTPLSPVLFDHGVDLLSGSIVEDMDAVLQAVCQGANFRQIHRQGVRLVTMQRDDFKQGNFKQSF